MSELMNTPSTLINAQQSSSDTATLNRRAALAKLGIAATIAYTTPVLLSLKSAAAKSGGGSGGGPDGGGQGGGGAPPAGGGDLDDEIPF